MHRHAYKYMIICGWVACYGRLQQAGSIDLFGVLSRTVII